MADPALSPTERLSNHFVSVHATQTDTFDLEGMSLVGIMGKPGEMKALFRAPTGAIATATEGMFITLGQIFEITEAGVVITQPNGNAIFVPPIPIG